MTIKLTNIGRLAATYGAVTPARWWASLVHELDAEADAGGNELFILAERIKGMDKLRTMINQHGLDWLRETEE